MAAGMAVKECELGEIVERLAAEGRLEDLADAISDGERIGGLLDKLRIGDAYESIASVVCG